MDELTKQFNKNGFVLFKNQLSTAMLDSLDVEYNRLHDKASTILDYVHKANISLADFYQLNRDELIVVPEASDPLKVCRFEYIDHCSKIFNELVTLNMKSLIDNLISQPVVLFKDKCNVKNKGGGAFPPHQDIAAYYHFKPTFHITAAIMLDDSTLQNGCVEMAHGYNDIPGIKMKDSRLVESLFGTLPFFDFYQGGTRNGDIKDAISKELHWEPVEAKKGDVILFHSFVPHRSQKNNTQLPRRNLFFTFNLASEGDFYQEYYLTKKCDFHNPIFHVSTPTEHNQNKAAALKLFTPGPLNTLPTVRAAMNVDIGTRTQTLMDLTKTLRSELEDIAHCGDEYTNVPMQGSGTFAVEAMLSTLLHPDSFALIISNGVYAERITKICQIHQIKHRVLACPPTQSIDLQVIDKELATEKGITHIIAVHFETALGVLNDINGLLMLAEKNNVHVLIDAMSTFGALTLKYTSPALLAVAASSNKCLHSTPGIGFVFARKQALTTVSHQRTLSLDLRAQWYGLEQSGQWRFTPPTQVLLALREAILQFKAAGGTSARLEKYARLNKQLIEGLAALTILPVINDKYRAPMITTFSLGDDCPINTQSLYEKLFSQGFIIYSSALADDKSFRVGCMGEIDTNDIHQLVCSIKEIVYG